MFSEAAFPTILLHGGGYLWCSPCVSHCTFSSWGIMTMASNVLRCHPALQVLPSVGSTCWWGCSAIKDGLRPPMLLPPGCQGRQKSIHSFGLDFHRWRTLGAWVAFSWWRPYWGLFQPANVFDRLPWPVVLSLHKGSFHPFQLLSPSCQLLWPVEVSNSVLFSYRVWSFSWKQILATQHGERAVFPSSQMASQYSWEIMDCKLRQMPKSDIAVS